MDERELRKMMNEANRKLILADDRFGPWPDCLETHDEDEAKEVS